MKAARKQRDLGSAISIEDALSMLTIIFVVFMLILVPLVNIDRVRLEKENKDPFWQKVASSFGSQSSGEHKIAGYSMAFDLDSAVAGRISETDKGRICYIEAMFRDSSLTVIRHDRRDNSFTAVFCQNGGTTRVFRKGSLLWNSRNREWMVSDFTADYGEDPESLSMETNYRAWFLDMLKKQG
jgi:hypothetical protein